MDELQSDDSIETVLDVDSFGEHYRSLYNNYGDISEANSQDKLFQCSLNDESLMLVEEENNNSSSSFNSWGNVELYNEPSCTQITKQTKSICSTFENSSEIEILHQQFPIKKHIASYVVIDTSKDLNSFTKHHKKNSLNSEKIAIPKSSDLTEIELCHSSQIKKTPPVSVVPNTGTIPKSTTNIKKLQPKLKNAKAGYTTRQELEYKVTSSNKSNPKIYIIPPNGVNYMIQKGECNSRSSKSNYSTSSIVKTIDSKLVEQKKKSSITPKFMQFEGTKIAGFLPGIQKYSEGTLKMIPSQEKVPVSLKNVFKKNSLFVKQIETASPMEIEPKMNDFSSSGKSLSSSHKYAKTKETTHVKNNKQIIPARYSWNTISNSDKFNNKSKDKFIPHTITSKDVLENQKNIIVENCEIKIKTSSNQEKFNSSGFLQLTPRSNTSNESNSQSLSITRYGKIPNNERTALQLLSLDSPESKTNSNSKDSFIIPTENLKEVFSSEIRASKRKKVTRAVEEHSTNKILLSEEISEDEQSKFYDEDDNDVCGQFVLCNNDYCDTIVHKLELIDNLYCSLDCKNLNSNKMVAVNESCIEFKRNVNPSKKSEIDRKQLLGSDTSIEENQSPQNNSLEIDVDDVYDYYGGDSYFNLKYYTNDIAILDYVEKMLIESAPKKLFANPFPTENNSFKIGEKLEGIDPEHEVLFCVLTVIEVCGYRLKLHFDGYSHDYDFWVNADSPNLFYPKWCKRNLRLLQPPKNYGSNFDWDNYLQEKQANPAPEWKFVSTKNSSSTVLHQFCVGAKLEALDKWTRTLPKQLICVATVADILGNRIRIHFDGWTDDFDYWIDITSTNIHPVGWCEKNGRNLSPPSGYNDFKGKKPFSWKEYLKETNSEPVPEDAFVCRPLKDFSINMKIEVVDLVVPSLIRIATVIDFRGDEIKILYDGFHMKYAYWIEDDSEDIHPVGWSLKTNHPIEIPSRKDNPLSCQVDGCNSKGNSNCLKNYHVFINECPYELDNWKGAVAGMAETPDRIKTNGIQILNSTSVTCSKSQNFNHYKAEKKKKCKLNKTENINLQKQTITYKTFNEQLNIQNDESKCSVDNLSEIVQQNTTNEENIDLRENILKTSLPLNINQLSLPTRNRVWTSYNSFIGIEIFCTTDTRTWSVNDVVAYVDSMVSNIPNISERTSICNRFIEHEIDGEAFLMLTRKELVDWLQIPLGPAVKIASAILMLRDRVPMFDAIELNYKEF